MNGKWHSVSIESAFRELGSSPSGLSLNQVQASLLKHGYNELAEKKKDPWYVLFLEQFRSLPILMLIAAAAISAALGKS